MQCDQLQAFQPQYHATNTDRVQCVGAQDYFAAEGARAFDDLASIVEDISSIRADGGEWARRIKDSLKAGKPLGGNVAADRLAATCKCHIRIYLNEGHHVTTAEEMRETLLSHGGVEGVRVPFLPSINQTVELQNIPGINKLNIFQFTDGSLQVWRANAIGPGKSIEKGKVSGQCHLITLPMCIFSYS